MVTSAGDSQARPAPPSLTSPRTTLAPRMIGVSMLGRYYRLMYGRWSCFRDRAARTLRASRCSHCLSWAGARRLLIHAGSTVPAIAQDGPSSERGPGTSILMSCYSRVVRPCAHTSSLYRASPGAAAPGAITQRRRARGAAHLGHHSAMGRPQVRHSQ